MSLRICILEADDLHPALQERFIGFGAMFKTLFSAQDPAVDFQVFNVVRGEYPAHTESFDAYLVTGSKADAFANDPWIVTLAEYVRERFAQGDVLLGICFGHQIIALALGGDTQRSNKGWGIGLHRYTLSYQPAWLVDDLEAFQLLISHRDQVTALPEGAEVLASSAFCENAAFVLGQQVLCFQGHPEFTADFSRGLLQIRESIYDADQYQAACQSLAHRHDGARVACWMLSFVKAAQAERNSCVPAPVSTQAGASLCLP